MINSQSCCQNALKAIVLLNFLAVGFLEAAPAPAAAAAAPGPDFNNIQYLHNLTLKYNNGTVQGLDAIDGYSDVDSQMAQSLKEAINSAMPGYIASLPSSSNSGGASTSSATPVGSPMVSTTPSPASATGAPLNLITPSSSSSPLSSSSSPMARNKRDASSSTTTTTSTSTASGSSPSSTVSPVLADAPSLATTTQAYGTDEEFYARTDLVHFHVDVDLPEGSGNTPFAMSNIQ